MTLLLLLQAHAEEPLRPVLDEAAASACPAVGLTLNVPYKPPCAAVAVSLAQMSWFAEMAAYADTEHDLRTLERVSFEQQLRYSVERADFYKKLVETPVKAKMPAAGWFGLGVGTGIIAILGSAVAVRWASEVPVTTAAQ